MIKKIKKKGELTTQNLVILIILIISFIVIIFLLFRLQLGKTTGDQACHNSVVLRANSILSDKIFPLNCHRSYVCISADKTCEKMITKDIEKVKTKNETYKVLAQELADCWWMFGEGEVNYVGKDMKPKIYCSICDQIAFDDSMKKIFPDGNIDEKSLYDFMAKEKISDEEMTYIEYLYQDIEGTPEFNSLSNFGKINLDKEYYILTGMTSDINNLGYIVAGSVVGAAAASIIFTGGISTPIVAVLAIEAGALVGGGGGTILSVVVEGKSGNHYNLPTIVEVNSEDFKKLECEEITTLA